MPRKGAITRRAILPDRKYNSVLLARFISCIMKRGKKSLAEAVVYDALDIVEKKTGQPPLTVFKEAINKVKPVLEVRSRRVGGATYQVPVEVRQERRIALGIRWLINYSRQRPERTMAEALAAEMISAAKNEGLAIKKKEDTHRMAEANKAFAHYRW